MTNVKDNNGKGMLEYICSYIYKEDNEFPANWKESYLRWNSKATDVDIIIQKGNELKMMYENANQACKEVSESGEPSDPFQTEVG